MTALARTPARYWAVRFEPGADTAVSTERVYDVDAAGEDCVIVGARNAEEGARLARRARQRQLRRRDKERRELARQLPPASRQDAPRLRVLLEVQQWWREALTVDAFARRVALEIQQLSERARSDAA